MKSSMISLSRQGVLLIRYSLSPDRYNLRVLVSSLYSTGKMPLSFTNVRETSAIPRAFLLAVPLKITLLIELERSRGGRRSPNTHRSPSPIFDVPHPLGPTIAVLPLPHLARVVCAQPLHAGRRGSAMSSDK